MVRVEELLESEIGQLHSCCLINVDAINLSTRRVLKQFYRLIVVHSSHTVSWPFIGPQPKSFRILLHNQTDRQTLNSCRKWVLLWMRTTTELHVNETKHETLLFTIILMVDT